MRCEPCDMAANGNRLVGEALSQDIRFITFGIADDEVYASSVKLFHPRAQPRNILMGKGARIVFSEHAPRADGEWGVHVHQIALLCVLQHFLEVAVDESSPAQAIRAF